MFTYHDQDIWEVSEDDLTREGKGSARSEAGFVKYDLYFDAYENNTNNEINLVIKYSTHLYKKTTIEKFAQHYLEILEQVIENIDIKLEDIAISRETVDIQPGFRAQDYLEFNF